MYSNKRTIFSIYGALSNRREAPAKARAVLRDLFDDGERTLISNHPSEGYRFSGAVEWHEGNPPRLPGRTRWLACVVGGAAVLVLVVVLMGSLPGWAAPAIPFYNVRDYGAVGDGAAKDTEAIRTAISTAAGAGGGTRGSPDDGPDARGQLVRGLEAGQQ